MGRFYFCAIDTGLAFRSRRFGLLKLGIVDRTPNPLGNDGHLQVGDIPSGKRVNDGMNDCRRRTGVACLGAAFDAQQVRQRGTE